MASKQAVLSVETLAVCCPHCGEPQPSPDNGSDAWVPRQVREWSGKTIACVSCDGSFRIHAETKVMMPISEEELKEIADRCRPWGVYEDCEVILRLIAEVRRLQTELELERIGRKALHEQLDYERKIMDASETSKVRAALGCYGMPAWWGSDVAGPLADNVWAPLMPSLVGQPGWVLARKVLGWSEPSEPCDNPSCDGVKDDKTFGDAHRCFKDGRWLDDGSEM